MRIGSLFSGYMGLDRAVEAFFGAETVWVSDVDPGANLILAHRTTAPNLGDITKIDWAEVEPVDILTGGFPCQDLSLAGKRAGLRPGTRSGLWEHMAYAIDQLRPRYVIAENVRGLLSARAHSDVEPCPWCLGGAGDGEPDLRALGAVLGDLAELGYDARWFGLRAADVGAPHGRFRVFVLATDTTREPGRVGNRDDVRAGRGKVGREQAAGRSSAEDADVSASRKRRESAPGQAEGRWARADAGGRDRAPATDSEDDRLSPRVTSGREPQQPRPEGDRFAPADSASIGRHQGRAEPAGIVGGSDAAVGGHAPADSARSAWRGSEQFDLLPQLPGQTGHEQPRERPGTADPRSTWGAYGAAIQRWERALSRRAPSPTQPGRDGRPRLSPRFVEWMMGLPAGWVTDVPGLSRNAQLKALGNGVVPQQAFRALELMWQGLAPSAATSSDAVLPTPRAGHERLRAERAEARLAQVRLIADNPLTPAEVRAALSRVLDERTPDDH